MDYLGPIYQLPKTMWRAEIFLCFGEDEVDWFAALEASGIKPNGPLHRYRGSVGFVQQNKLFFLAGIGTSAVEATVHEICKNADSVILVGTAGFVGNVPAGANAIPQAFAAISSLPATRICASNWPTEIEGVSVVSTELFYTFSPIFLQTGSDDELVHAVAAHLDGNGPAGANFLVDMETYPFYYFMRQSEANFVSIRAPTNPLTDFDAMPDNATSALSDCIKKGLQFFAANLR